MKKATFLVLTLFLFLIFPFPSVFADDWVSPDGHVETAEWTGEEFAYDENTASGTFKLAPFFPIPYTTGFLTLTLSSSIQCNKIRQYVVATNTDWMDIDVYKDDAWVDIYTGDYMGNDYYYEIGFAEGTVSQIRMRFRITVAFSSVSVREVDFWEVEGVTQYELNVNSLPFQNVNFTLNGTTYQTNYTDVLDEGSYNVSFPSIWVNNSITYVFKNWSDGTTDPSKILNLNANTTLTVTYVLPPPTPQAHILFVGASVVFGFIGFIFVLAWKRKREIE